ncbi:hypothetical protein SY88_05900 [Clostridiales bacterium PH28_bin88]|nr:hypothetical protein SY88_05900 [Clostridiales bacterium PH28_bin88]
MSRVRPGGTEEVPILSALGRVLAQDVRAREDIPPFDRSPLDGYAVRAEDLAGATRATPAALKVIAEVPAGRVSPLPVSPGTAVKIMTGAPIPPGANAVVKVEDTDGGGELVRVFSSLRPESNIARAGEDVQMGELVLEKGMVLRSGAIGMLAAVGVSPVPVYRKPRVAVLCTGEELVDILAFLSPGKIRNSNLYGLAAAIMEAGGEPVLMATVPDRLEDIITQLEQALEAADLVVTTGGASVGEYDLMRDAFRLAGAEMLFWRVAMKPGTPALAAEKDGKLLIGLSGNPAAALIAFEHLVRPAILLMGGRQKWQRPRASGVMAEGFAKGGGPRRFLRVTAHREGGGYRVDLTGKQSPGVLQSILRCNALVDVPAGSSPLQAGQEVQLILLTESEDAE